MYGLHELLGWIKRRNLEVNIRIVRIAAQRYPARQQRKGMVEDRIESIWFGNESVAKHTIIHSSEQETGQSIPWSFNNRFTGNIERCVQQDRHTGFFVEEGQQPMQQWRCFLGDRLHASRSVHVHDCRNHVFLALLKGHDAEHEWATCMGRLYIKPITNIFFPNHGCEWSESFAEFYPAIQNIFHVGISGITQNAPLAKRSRAQFRSSLEPANDFALCQ